MLARTAVHPLHGVVERDARGGARKHRLEGHNRLVRQSPPMAWHSVSATRAAQSGRHDGGNQAPRCPPIRGGGVSARGLRVAIVRREYPDPAPDDIKY